MQSNAQAAVCKSNILTNMPSSHTTVIRRVSHRYKLTNWQSDNNRQCKSRLPHCLAHWSWPLTFLAQSLSHIMVLLHNNNKDKMVLIFVRITRNWLTQDLNFKTKTLKFFQDQDQAWCSRARPRLCIPRPRLRPFCDVYLETDRKAFFIFGRKRKCRRKWNSIYAKNETKTKMDIHFRPKNENESHLTILVFFFLF